MADTSNSGIYVIESPARGQAIDADGDSVTAFVGPAPRGPVDHAVHLSAYEEFQKIFGAPQYHCRMAFAVRQFFANGGRRAVVVRVCGTSARNSIRLPGEAGDLILEARNPGPLEYLRASVDYDGVDQNETANGGPFAYQHNFNLVIQRLRDARSAWIDEQECYRNVSVDRGSRDYIGYVLSQSELVQLAGDAPPSRPLPTIKPTTMREAGYVEAMTSAAESPVPGDYDLIGSTAAGTGLSALEHVPDIGHVCLISGREGASLGPVALLAADRFCRDHQSMLIIDPPSRWASVDDVISDQERSGFVSPNAVTWFPALRIENQMGESVCTSMVGTVAAALNAANRASGVFHLHREGPMMLRGRTRPTVRLETQDIRRLARVGINGLVQRSPLHLQLLGNVTQARHGSMEGHWDNLELRQRVLFVLRRIRYGTRWTLFQESNPETWAEVTAQVTDFLTELHARSILAGAYATDAFFVRCDNDTNAGLAGQSGAISLIVGFALRRPGEFLAFRLHRSKGNFRITGLGWQSGFAQAV